MKSGLHTPLPQKSVASASVEKKWVGTQRNMFIMMGFENTQRETAVGWEELLSLAEKMVVMMNVSAR